jgi:hypothetical protein
MTSTVTADELNSLLNKLMRGCINLVLLAIVLNYRVWNPKEGGELGRFIDFCICISLCLYHCVTFSLKL